MRRVAPWCARLRPNAGRGPFFANTRNFLFWESKQRYVRTSDRSGKPETRDCSLVDVAFSFTVFYRSQSFSLITPLRGLPRHGRDPTTEQFTSPCPPSPRRSILINLVEQPPCLASPPPFSSRPSRSSPPPLASPRSTTSFMAQAPPTPASSSGR